MKTLILLALQLLLTPCSTGFSQEANAADESTPSAMVETSPTAPTVIKKSLGETRNVHQLGNLYFSGQFTESDINKLKEEKIKRIISLRTDGEINWDEKEAVEAAGLSFADAPFRAPDSLNDRLFDRVRELLKDDSQPTLLHCGSANRVGGVWLPYRVLDEGVDLETAIAEAKEIGLKSPFIEQKAIDYIKRNLAPTMAGEPSVKPGVNKKFVDPNLDVDAFVKRFEIESREVYVNREKILSACEIQTGDTVADVGAGTGLFTRMFAGKVGTEGWVYAVDIAPRFIKHINHESMQQKLENITGVLCPENSINLPPKSSDVIFVCDTYHHFEYPKSTLASIKNALKDDGHLIVIDFDRIEGTSREWLINHVRAGKEVFRAEIQDAGFVLVEEKKIDGFEENYFLKFQKD